MIIKNINWVALRVLRTTDQVINLLAVGFEASVVAVLQRVIIVESLCLNSKADITAFTRAPTANTCYKPLPIGPFRFDLNLAVYFAPAFLCLREHTNVQTETSPVARRFEKKHLG